MNYDVIIIGTGAGGGTLLHSLQSAGKNILVLERGSFLPKEKANWNTVEVFQKDRYHTHEVWRDKEGKAFKPGTGYWVGGNTKVYGAALFRLREKDFEAVAHAGGISPEWHVKYADFEPYYAKAEKLYNVHGSHGLDHTEAWRSEPFPHPPVSHEPRIQELHHALANRGFHPFYIPLGVKLNEADRLNSACIRCDTCDGFPCLIDAKSDADINAVRPAIKHGNITLVTNAKVLKLNTSASGREITGVVAEVNGETITYNGSIVVVSCGAINSAALFLKSANDKHPNGLANGSGQVGRNFMKHHNGAILGLSTKPNPTVFQKTLAVNDFYWGDDAFHFPMGHVQLLGKVNGDMLEADAPAFAPDFALDKMAQYSIDWWLTAEDLPLPENRVEVRGDDIVLHYSDHNLDGFNRLMKRWTETLKEVESGDAIVPHSLYFRKKIPLQAVGHQCGTLRFGADAQTSVLDLNCKAHELDNLYAVDGSFFPSSAAVNPSLTIMANALRVGDHLIERLK
jgi:choline dehydrogenase-like flavoprotein